MWAQASEILESARQANDAASDDLRDEAATRVKAFGRVIVMRDTAERPSSNPKTHCPAGKVPPATSSISLNTSALRTYGLDMTSVICIGKPGMKHHCYYSHVSFGPAIEKFAGEGFALCSSTRKAKSPNVDGSWDRVIVLREVLLDSSRLPLDRVPRRIPE
ncbi:hypothetical protein MMC22_007169 [Lobaria immixta]|nr:hypothetical protein [Lobaria immixta]